MNQNLRVTACCAVLLASAAILAGCSTGSPSNNSGGGGVSIGGGGGSSTGTTASCLAPGAPVAVGIGARSNSPQPVLTDAVKTAMNNAVNARLAVTIIRIDGNPAIVYSQAFSPTGANTQSVKAEYNAYVTGLNQVLSGTAQQSTDIRAQVSQVNVLQALAIAAGEVGPGGNVIVMDSGLQTTSPLNFTTGLLGDDPKTITSFLQNAHELPDLTGRHVEFVGLGWTASPQQELSIADRSKVGDIWYDIATAAGASCVVIDQTPDTNAALSGRPLVSVVVPPPPPQPPVKCSVTNLDDANNVGFEFASTAFRDPSGATATLRQLAAVIMRSGESVTLTGATSSEGSDSYNTQLSLERAKRVASALIALGVPASRISTFGDGAHLPGRLNDRAPNGQLLIGPAIQNRKVVAKLSGNGC
jgi:outer membrane protein OmpA-like peptidoglycan-associated protein